MLIYLLHDNVKMYLHHIKRLFELKHKSHITNISVDYLKAMIVVLYFVIAPIIFIFHTE